MTAPGVDDLFADVRGIESAVSVFGSASSQFREVKGAAIDAGIPAAFPGGSQAAAAAVDRAAAALSDRSHALSSSCASSLQHLQTTDEEFAATLRGVIPR